MRKLETLCLRTPIVAMFCFLLAVATQSRAETMIITVPSASVYRTSDESGKSTLQLKQGRKILSTGTAVNGFVPTKTRSGATVWLHASDLAIITPVVPAAPVTSALTAKPTREMSEGNAPKARSFLGIERVTVDVGAGGGAYNAVSYEEIDFGISAYFESWLAWRNALFARFPQGLSNIYGLDSSARFVLDIPLIVLFAGPGYRFANQNSSVPFAEAGLVAKAGGLSIGGGIKYLFDSFVHSGQPNDTEYFIIFAGGGVL